MASVGLFFQNKRSYGLGNITFDLLLSESHSLNNTITEYNIEDGSSIADHIYNNLRTGSISGLVTNFSINSEGITSNRAKDAYDLFVELWKNKELVTLTTVLEVYDNVAIENVSTSVNDGTGESLVFDVSFRQINIVKLQEIQATATISIDDMDSDINKQSAVEADQGKTTPVNRSASTGAIF